MAYTRFSRDCRWYVYPLADSKGIIECKGANASFQWLPDENLKHFKTKVMKAVKKPGKGYFHKDEADELFAILNNYKKEIADDRKNMQAGRPTARQLLLGQLCQQTDKDGVLPSNDGRGATEGVRSDQDDRLHEADARGDGVQPVTLLGGENNG